MKPTTILTVLALSHTSTSALTPLFAEEMSLTKRQDDGSVNDEPTFPCGNGIVDEGEDCDCGDDWTCRYSHSNSCCDYMTCKFKEGAVCDDHSANNTCCENCQFKLKGTICHASKDPICDPIEEVCSGTSGACPVDKFMENGKSCGTGKECASGFCTSREDYCKEYYSQHIPSRTLNNLFNGRNHFVEGSCITPAQWGDEACLLNCSVRGVPPDNTFPQLYCVTPETVTPIFFRDGLDCSDVKKPWIHRKCFNGTCVNTHNTTIPPGYVDEDSTSNSNPSDGPRPSSSSAMTLIIATAASIGGFLVLCALFYFFWYKNRKAKKNYETSRALRMQYFNRQQMAADGIVVVTPGAAAGSGEKGGHTPLVGEFYGVKDSEGKGPVAGRSVEEFYGDAPGGMDRKPPPSPGPGPGRAGVCE